MKFTIKYNGKVTEHSKKVSLLSLVGSENKDLVCAKVNNRIRELTYEVYYDAEIEFLTVKDQDAIRTYETSLRYLVAMAFERVYPQIEIRLCYNVSRSIFVQILTEGVHADTKMVEAIRVEMEKLIQRDIPFNRTIVTNEEASKLYAERGFHDKLEILKYRPEKTVHI